MRDIHPYDIWTRCVPRSKIREKAVIYFLVTLEPKEVLYIGQTTHLQTRLASHSKSIPYTHVYHIDGGEEPFKLEEKYIKKFAPRYNKTHVTLELKERSYQKFVIYVKGDKYYDQLSENMPVTKDHRYYPNNGDGVKFRLTVDSILVCRENQFLVGVYDKSGALYGHKLLEVNLNTTFAGIISEASIVDFKKKSCIFMLAFMEADDSEYSCKLIRCRKDDYDLVEHLHSIKNVSFGDGFFTKYVDKFILQQLNDKFDVFKE
jgi:hypothetical protein